MTYNVHITEYAERDLLDSAIYISHTLSNNIAANRLLDEAYDAAQSLSENPMRQPLVRDDFLASKGLRSLAVEKYLLFYIVREETNRVNIIRFIHSRRDWASLFDNVVFEEK